MSQQIKHLYEFGPFRLDPQRRVLLCANEPVALTPKAIETLIVLVQNRQRVVPKDELMKLLWPDSFVEEANLSQNIFLLRKALGDSTQERRYILTVPGRGYQFTETVREVAQQEEEESLVVATHTRSEMTVERVAPASGRRFWVVGAIALALAALGGAWWSYHRPPGFRTFKQQRLTANTPDEPIDSTAISPDGKYVGYSDRQGIHVRLVATGEEQVMPWPRDVKRGEALWSFSSWYPDSTRFLALLAIPGTPASLWSVPILGGEPQRLIEDVDQGTSISPDGGSIAFFRVRSSYGSREIWLMGPYGQAPHKILTADDRSSFFGVAWSPTGNRIAFSSRHQDGSSSIEICDRDGKNRARILEETSYADSFAWVLPGRFIFTRYVPGAGDYYSDDLWDVPVDGNTGRRESEPHRLTGWSGFWVKSLTATADGKHLEFLRGTSHESVFVGDVGSEAGRLNNVRRLTLDDYSDIPLAWTSDSQHVIFSSMRSGHREIYEQAIDGNTSAQVLTSDPTIGFFLARVTPDGGSLIVEGSRRGSRELGVYKMELRGGVPRQLARSDVPIAYWCTNQSADFCVYGSLIPDEKELVVRRLEENGDGGHELLRIPVNANGDYHWALAPDGSQIAILETRWDSGEVRFFPLHGAKSRAITVKGYANLQSLDWTPDSRKMLIATSGPGGVALLRVNLDGSAEPIWHESRLDATWGIPSPDGRHVATDGSSWDANAWMVEDF